MTDAATGLAATLARALADLPDGALCVACSGGADSTVLLHALAALPAARARGLRALHVDHGMHPHSPDWAARVQASCVGLGVPCTVCRVEVAPDGRGSEAAAREARYGAFAAELRPGEWLLLGHHRDDQVETVLLKLLRGAGPEGLGGMLARRPLGRGHLWRPLLALPRAALRSYLDVHGLTAVDDPSNADPGLSRNFLRLTVLPSLQQHWPHAADSILHSARLCREAADTLGEQWRHALEALRDPATGSLAIDGWLALPPALRAPLLDGWLHDAGLSAPTASQRGQIERQCRARPDRQPCIRWAGTELHVWKGRLWARRPVAPPDRAWQATWHGESLDLPGGGQLRLDPAVRLERPVRVGFRQGGERIRPAGDPHTRELRDLFQQAAMPPWQRAACPLLYLDGTLVGVADRWLDARALALFGAARPRWIPPA